MLVLSTATSSRLLQWDSWRSCTATFTWMPNGGTWWCVLQCSALCYLSKYWGSPHFWVLLLHPEGPKLSLVAQSNLPFRKCFLFPYSFYNGPFKWLHFSHQSPPGSTSAGINHWDTPLHRTSAGYRALAKPALYTCHLCCHHLSWELPSVWMSIYWEVGFNYW